MADDKHYVPGDFYRIDDRTGFKVRAGKTRKEWTGLIVREQSWEARHPQDYVRGTRDSQAVPQPRPRQVESFQGPLGTTLIVTAVPNGSAPWFIYVENTARFYIGDLLHVMQDNGENKALLVIDVQNATNLQVDRSLAFQASAGNIVINVTAESDPVIDLGGQGVMSGSGVYTTP